MPVFLVLSLLCAPAARAQDAAAKELARVQSAEQRLRARAVAHSRAAREKARALEIAEAAARRAQSVPDSAESRNRAAERAAADARDELKEARERAADTRKDFVGSGRGYLAAEDRYLKATGEYYNEWQYDRVSALLNRPPRKGEELPDFGTAPLPGGPPDPASPGPDAPPPPDAVPPDPGEDDGPADDAPPLDVVLADALAMNFRPAAPVAGRRGAATAPPAAHNEDPVARSAPSDGAPTMGLDRAILLSRPFDGADAAAPRRPTVSAQDGPRAALVRAEEALARNPKDAKAWEAKAAALNALRRFDEAEEAAERAVRLDPGNPKGYRALAWAQLHNGKPDAALANATRMIFLDPDNAEGYLLRAFAYEMKGERAKMLADLERAAARNPKYANHLARARAGLRLFDPDSPETAGLFEALPPPPRQRSNALAWLGAFLLGSAGLFAAARAVPAILAGTRNAAPPPPAADGALLAEKYRLGRVLGPGGPDPVREAFDTTLERVVAVKEVSAQDPALRARCLERARAAAGVRHPNIAEIYEVLDLPAGLRLVFEWAPGKTAAQLLREKGRLSLDEAKALLAPVCEALAAAHGRGVVHGGLKPRNLMVSADGGVKLLDLGVARDGPATPAADVDALAACLGELAPGPAVAALVANHPSDASAFKAALLAL